MSAWEFRERRPAFAALRIAASTAQGIFRIVRLRMYQLSAITVLRVQCNGVSWQPEIDEIRRREAIAREMGGTANVERQHKAGRLTVRERIARLLDSDSFHEIGAIAGKAVYDDGGQLSSFTPSNFVTGTGKID